MTGRLGDRGGVAAEFAVTLPAVALVLAAGLTGLAAGGQLIRLQDGAADAARLLARGESFARAEGHVAATVPGAAVQVSHAEGLVCVHLRSGAGGGALSAWQLTARSCALADGL